MPHLKMSLNAIWYDMKFYAHQFFLAHCVSFMSRWPLLRWRGGQHICSWETTECFKTMNRPDPVRPDHNALWCREEGEEGCLHVVNWDRAFCWKRMEKNLTGFWHFFVGFFFSVKMVQIPTATPGYIQIPTANMNGSNTHCHPPRDEEWFKYPLPPP